MGVLHGEPCLLLGEQVAVTLSWREQSRLRALRATALTAAADPAFERFARMVRRDLRVPIALVSLVDADRQFFPGQAGLPSPLDMQRQTPLSRSVCQRVVDTGEILVVSDARTDPRVRNNPVVAELNMGAYLGVPLTDSDGFVLGSLCALDHRPRDWSDLDVEVLTDLAAACSSELRLRIAADRSSRALARLALLSQISQAIGSTLDEQEAMLRLSRLVVPALADWCTVHVADEAGRLQTAAAQHRAQERSVVLDEFAQAQALIVDSSSAVRQALRTQEAVLLDELPGGAAMALAVGVEDAKAQQVCSELGCASALIVPLLTRDRAVGLLSLGRGAAREPFGEADVHDALDLGRRTGMAVQQAQTYSRQLHYAEALQRSMLTRLPEPDHLHVVARYVPAAEEAQVGGDWYDAFLQPDGATVLVVGDVTGHDITAAAMMGQLRNLVRGLAYDRQESPAQILQRADQALRGLQIDTLATVVLARVEQTEPDRRLGLRRLRWSNAGHLPPMVLRADGSVEVLDRPPDLLLGFDPDEPRADHQVELRPNDTVLLYTDGLVERRDSPLEHGIIRLRQALTGLQSEPLDVLCDELVERLVPERADDDIALVAIRTYSEARPRPAEAGPSRLPAPFTSADHPA